jgi:hypothetical protein
MTTYEQEWQSQEFEGEFEGEFENEFEGEFQGEFQGEFPGGFQGGFHGEFEGEFETETEGEFGETTELELAAELLEATSEAELEQFLGKVFKNAARGVGNFARSRAGRALGGILKSVAKKALPIAGAALGSYLIPGAGSALGGKLGSAAANLFELESEGLSEQELEFEMARRYVRLSGAAARHAARAPRSAPPRAVAQAAFVTAARRHAPGLLRGVPAGSRPRRPGSRQVPQRGGAPRRRPPTRFGDGPGISPAFGHGGYDTGDYGIEQQQGNEGSYGQDPAAGAPSNGRAAVGRWYRRGGKIIVVGA